MRRTYTFTAGETKLEPTEDVEGVTKVVCFATDAGADVGFDLQVAPVEATTLQTDGSGVDQEEAEDREAEGGREGPEANHAPGAGGPLPA